jgi:hypothetical protein
LSRLADAFQHGGFQRFVWGFAAPEHELEGGEETFAFGEGDIDEVFDGFGGGAGGAAQQDGVPVDSIRMSWLYFAVRSLRARLPVLIWPQLVATARSAMVESSVSPAVAHHRV